MPFVAYRGDYISVLRFVSVVRRLDLVRIVDVALPLYHMDRIGFDGREPAHLVRVDVQTTTSRDFQMLLLTLTSGCFSI